MNRLKFTYSFLTKKGILLFLICFVLLISFLPGSSQKTYRRHLIFALDNSKKYWDIERNKKGDETAMVALGRLVNGEKWDWVPVPNVLWNDKKNNFDLFDAGSDEISFIYFNNSIPIFSNDESPAKLKDFESNYFKKDFIWSKVNADGQNIENNIDYCFQKVSPSNINQSQFLYPLILDNIENTDYAEEYILIVISLDTIKTISDNDYKALNTILGNQVKTISNQIKKLYSLYDIENKPYFEGYQEKGTINQRVICGYRITPKNVKPGSAATAVTLNKDITFKQTTYKGDIYEISNLQFNFPKNEFLKPVGITLKITEIDNSTPLFEDEILHMSDVNNWESDFSESSRVLNYKNGVYSVNGLKIQLPDINSEKKPLNLELVIKTKVTDGIINPLNFVFYSKTEVSISGIIQYSNFTYWLFRLGPFLLLIILILVVIYYGKPLEIKFNINGYLDSYEIIDYVRFGKLHTPYKFWDKHSDSLVVDGEIIYKFPNYIFNWKPTVFVNLDSFSIPNGFDAFIKPNFQYGNEYHKGSNMPLRLSKNNKISFIICLKQNDINVKITEPKLIKIKISSWIRETRLFFIKKEITVDLEYNFHIGPDLGDVWVGLDPGTTGSCIAVGNQSNNVVIADDSSKIKVMDSKLIFEVSENYIQHNGEIPEYLYKFGTNARTKFGSEGVISFQSIKKLLGFRDRKVIRFNNHNTLELNGKDLSALLVKGLYSELKKFTERNYNVEYLHENKFNPKRAIIAIPNNFTISKIQDIIDCARQLKQFEEIRYVYEAEAVLFYYLSLYSRFNGGKASFRDENILVFDMGGATINASIVNATKTEENKKSVYNIDILGKIGYGIGGDSIDYCLLKFIKSFSNEYPEFKSLILYSGNKENLAKAARFIKLQIVDFYKKGLDPLIQPTQLESFLVDILKQPVKISEESKFYLSFTKDSSGNYKLFSHPIFVELIYNNVKDAVNEVIELSGNCKIDKVIFSGRSTFFPFIKETVEKQLKAAKNDAVKIVLNEEESKTAVAHGACWYGINKNSIRLNNLKTNASFGIKKTLSSDIRDVAFLELIKIGCAFNTYNAGIDQVKGEVFLNDNFSFDGAKVNFFQIMGKNADKILSENQKHKFSKIASIRIPLAIKAIQMVVSENDEIECKAKLVNNEIIVAKGVVSDEDITDANEEHYTWIVK